MIKRLFFIVVMVLPCLAHGADPSADLSVNVTPTPPAGAAAAGFTTLALDSEFSQPQPNGWFACSGGAAGAQWYQGVTGGDTEPAPCSVTNGQPGGNFNLVTDPLTGKQVLDLTMHLSDVLLGSLQYASIQTADDAEMRHGTPCCVLGELFPYGYYMEARYRVLTAPDADHGATAGVWTAFWQYGQGLSPYTSHNGVEIDHPEQHGELMWNYAPSAPTIGPELDWGVINWAHLGDGAPCFGSARAPGKSRCGQVVQAEDPRQYHTFGVRVTTDGSNGAQYCSYFDGTQSLCATGVFTIDTAQYAELKYPILFAGIECYDTVNSEGDLACLNISITSWYSCVSPAPVGAVCLSAGGAAFDNGSGSWASSISGVTGCSGCNGSWFLMPFSNGTGGTDYYIQSGTNDPTYTRPSWPGGSPTGGTINALSQVDMYIDHVRVWTCSNWASGPCNTAVGAPTLDVNNAASISSGANNSTNTVTTNGVSAADQGLVLWFYCTDSSCGNTADTTSWNVSGTLTGESCSIISGATGSFVTAAGTAGVGAALCTFTAGGNDTVTVSASGLATTSYIGPFAVYFVNANGVDTSCTNKTAQSATGTWSITAAGGTSAAHEVAASMVATFLASHAMFDQIGLDSPSGGSTDGFQNVDSSGTVPTNSGTLSGTDSIVANIVCLKSLH
jgi:hypothetical protein